MRITSRFNLKRIQYIALSTAILFTYQNCGKMAAVQQQQAQSSSVIDETDESLSRFEAAKGVIAASCTGCHFTGSTSGSLSFATEQDYLEHGLVVPGNLSRSKLIYRLHNYPVEQAGRNMPPTGPISQSAYDTLSRWVLNMPGATNQVGNYFTCNSTELPDGVDAKRLSKQQLYNTLHGLISRPLGASAATTIMSGSSNFFRDRVPDDRRAPFARGDSSLEYFHAKAYFDIADELATLLVASSRYDQFVSTYINYDRGSCSYASSSTLNTACREVLVRNFTLRAWGRPIEGNDNNSNNELQPFMTEFQNAANTTDGVNAMIFRALTSPQFLMQLMIDVTPTTNGNVHQLSSYGIARRLSFAYMQSGPDEGLLTIARTQNLNTDAGFQQALAYVSARSAPVMREFTDEWLKMYNLPQFLNLAHAKFQMIGQGLTLDDNLRTAMREEIYELPVYLLNNNRPVAEILTSNVSFARQPSLMAIYGQTTAAPAASTINEQNAVRFPASERGGLLTRAGYLLSGTHTERPVMRGVHVREQFLCLELSGVAPPDATITPLPTGTFTTREKFHTITQGPACIGCHSQINPVGFAFGHYNSLGAYQTSEPIFDAGGSYVSSLPVDARASLQTFLGVNESVNGGVEFSRRMAESQDFKRCLTQYYYSYLNGLGSRTRAQNSCSMQRMYRSIDGGGTMGDFVRAAAEDPRFKLRNLVK